MGEVMSLFHVRDRRVRGLVSGMSIYAETPTREIIVLLAAGRCVRAASTRWR